jgi:hypothetical protein
VVWRREYEDPRRQRSFDVLKVEFRKCTHGLGLETNPRCLDGRVSAIVTVPLPTQHTEEPLLPEERPSG